MKLDEKHWTLAKQMVMESPWPSLPKALNLIAKKELGHLLTFDEAIKFIEEMQQHDMLLNQAVEIVPAKDWV